MNAKAGLSRKYIIPRYTVEYIFLNLLLNHNSIVSIIVLYFAIYITVRTEEICGSNVMSECVGLTRSVLNDMGSRAYNLHVCRCRDM